MKRNCPLLSKMISHGHSPQEGSRVFIN